MKLMMIRKKKFTNVVLLISLLLMVTTITVVKIFCEYSETSNDKDVMDITTKKQKHDEPPLLTIVTGFSTNFLYRGITMLRSLVKVGYQGPVVIYIMYHDANETLSETLTKDFPLELENSPLNAKLHFVEMPNDQMKSYCFKPKLIQHYLLSNSNNPTQVLHWADTSATYLDNPTRWAQGIVDDGIDFVGYEGGLGMGENTHIDTYNYLNISKDYYMASKREILSGFWLINMAKNQVQSKLLQPWIDCAVLACHKCMAPLNSTKKLIRPIHGPPSMLYRGHRQDQSVFSLLIYDSINPKKNNQDNNKFVASIEIREDPDDRYIQGKIKRYVEATSIKLVDYDDQAATTYSPPYGTYGN